MVLIWGSHNQICVLKRSLNVEWRKTGKDNGGMKEKLISRLLQ